jgi:CubicO group peptidase (beta-lactamase class C family)
LQEIGGEVAPGFEAVRAAFHENFRTRREVGAACSVFFNGRCVVNLWGGSRDPSRGEPWLEDTLVPVFSSTKGMASFCLALAHSRGLIDYRKPVAEYWPEFAAGGKQNITVGELMSHRAGLCALRPRLAFSDLADPDRMADVCAAEKPAWEPGTRHGYHGMTLGWYTAELIRRVDPKGRSIGRFFREELAEPLGLDFYIGLPTSIPDERLAQLQTKGYVARMIFNMNKMPSSVVLGMLNPFSLTSRAFGNPKILATPAQYNDRKFLELEVPAANGVGTATSLAKIYGEFASGGESLGIRAETLSALADPVPAPVGGSRDVVLGIDTNFSLGFLRPSRKIEFGSSPRAYGIGGTGGSTGYADPDLKLGFGYAMNRLDYYLAGDPRAIALGRAAEACARRLLDESAA